MMPEKDCEKIVRSIKEFVNNKLQTVKRWDEKETLSAIVQVCTYHHDVSIRPKNVIV